MMMMMMMMLMMMMMVDVKQIIKNMFTDLGALVLHMLNNVTRRKIGVKGA